MFFQKKSPIVNVAQYCGTLLVFLLLPLLTDAATLSVSPATGVYQSGATFTVQIGVNSQGKQINAADGTVRFNPQELQVVSATRASSIFSLWTAEPAFSNSAGTITFSGGSPAGFSGAFGNVMTVTFRVLGSGTTRVNIANGSVLAADGMGTNVLTAMNGGTYTLSAVSTQPTPEVIVEYVPPANTPPAPVVTSPTHGESGNWSSNTTADLRWSLPAGVTAVRTLLNTSPTAVPTRVYDTPISTITLEDLDEGVSYFHIQFRNADGWGRVTHYKFAIDSTPAPPLTAALVDNVDPTNPVQTILLSTSGEEDNRRSPIVKYEYTINGGETLTFEDREQTKKITLPTLPPGDYTIVITAYNAAGSSTVVPLTFSITAFAAPSITTIPDQVTERTLPVIQGTTTPLATVSLVLSRGNTEPVTYVGTANEDGFYSIIIDDTLTPGVYTVTVSAVASDGATSETSAPRQFSVKEPGFIAFGSVMINVISIVLSLVSLVVVTVLLALYGTRKFLLLRRSVSKEAHEVLAIMKREFSSLNELLTQEVEQVAQSRKTKTLTKSEQHLVDALRAALLQAEVQITKEAFDVANLVDNDKIK